MLLEYLETFLLNIVESMALMPQVHSNYSHFEFAIKVKGEKEKREKDKNITFLRLSLSHGMSR